MAKKNSTKTATKEALQASEPKLQVIKGWKGVNFSEVSPFLDDYNGTGTREDNQTDLPFSSLYVQNNAHSTKLGALETSLRPKHLFDPEEGCALTGVCFYDRDTVYAAFKTTVNNVEKQGVYIWKESIPQTVYRVPFSHSVGSDDRITLLEEEITEIYIAVDTLTILSKYEDENGNYHGKIRTTDNPISGHRFMDVEVLGCDELENQASYQPSTGLCPVVSQPTGASDGFKFWVEDRSISAPERWWLWNGGVRSDTPVTEPSDVDAPNRLIFCYTVNTKFGSTTSSIGTDDEPGAYTVVRCSNGPEEWTMSNYAVIGGKLSDTNCYTQTHLDGTPLNYGRDTTVDIWLYKDDSTEAIYVGTSPVTFSLVGATWTTSWSYNWYGSMTDIHEWEYATLAMPDSNTTAGVPATWMTQIDGRLYFWGCPDKEYRLYIGGDVGKEFAVNTGAGGAHVDVDTGRGIEIRCVEKFKTYGGSAIVTILCSADNESNQHRFNLIETNVTVTSSIEIFGYKAEEISNVESCTSRHGAGAWSDGLYYTNRNGLMVTTQQMEYSSQLKSSVVSDPISPVFEYQRGTDLNDTYVVCIRDVIYMITKGNSESRTFDDFIWVYDIALKAWYTLQPANGTSLLKPNGLFNYDNESQLSYGLGIITETGVWALPLIRNKETIDRTIYRMDSAGHTQYDADFVFGSENPMPDIPNVYIETAELATSMPATQWQFLDQVEFDFDYFIGECDVTVEGVDYYGRRIFVTRHIKQDAALTSFREFLHIGTRVRYYHITISGKAYFRLTCIPLRVYTQSKKIAQVYGYESQAWYTNRKGQKEYNHDYVSCYNNLAKHNSRMFVDPTTHIAVDKLLEDCIVT